MPELGKPWEDYFRKTWKAQFPGTFIFRLKDDVSGFKQTSANPCDFLCYPEAGKFLMIECKAHAGASVPFSALPQYERLLEYNSLKNVFPGFLVWLYEKDIIFWCPIETAKQIYEDGEKSIGIRHFDDYNIIIIPGEKKRTFITPDYSKLLEAINDR